jgi:hypothetical protein
MTFIGLGFGEKPLINYEITPLIKCNTISITFYFPGEGIAQCSKLEMNLPLLE